MALDGRVMLAWQPVTGAATYVVYRGASSSAVTTPVTPLGGATATQFVDMSVSNGTPYYYLVRAVVSGTETGDSNMVQSTPLAATCSSGNPIHRENCFPGSGGWKMQGGANVSDGGIEGYATVSSIDQGGSVDLKVNTTDDAPYRIEIWRSGLYGGGGGRLYSVIAGLRGVAQSPCQRDGPPG